jgi:predicted ATP-dependent endonuclease of OLD family
MIIYHLKIENFRGIRTLDWHLKGRVLCLIVTAQV